MQRIFGTQRKSFIKIRKITKPMNDRSQFTYSDMRTPMSFQNDFIIIMLTKEYFTMKSISASECCQCRIDILTHANTAIWLNLVH